MASFPNRVFVYGTLKRDFPNNYVISDDNHSLFIGEAKLVEPHRMVSIEEYGVPYLLSANTGSDQQAPKVNHVESINHNGTNDVINNFKNL